MKVIDQINESGIFAQSAYSAATATKDSSGRVITDTYMTNDKEPYWYRQGSGVSGQLAFVDDTFAIQVRLSGKNQADEETALTAGIILPGASPTSAKQLATFTTGGHVAWVEAPFIATEMGVAFISDVESAVSGKQDTLTFGYNSNNKINSINNSALAGEGGGAEYEGIDPIVVDNDEHKISANTWDLAVGDGLSAQDDTANNTTTILLTGDYYSASNPSGFITGVDLTPYQTKADMTAYQASGDYISAYGFVQHITNTANSKYLSFWNEAGGSTATAYPAIYLNGQFGSAYYKDNELKLGRAGHMIAFNIGGAGPKISAAATGNADAYMMLYNTKVSATLNQSGLNIKNSTADENVTIASIQSWNAKGDMHESAFAYDTANNITAYNGSAFKAGGDIPEGVMVESGLGYNAANEISAYNGSAIANANAGRQSFIHDDTLVHISDSAQYALGVNLSAVARALGIDETLLWSGNLNAPSAITLSESANNFDHVKIYFNDQNDYREIKEFDTVNKVFPLNIVTPYASNRNSTIIRYAMLSSDDYINYNYTAQGRALLTTGSNNFTAINQAGPYVTRIIGVGRKN